MKNYFLTVLASILLISGCKSRVFNATANLAVNQGSDFELSNDSNPDSDFENVSSQSSTERDFVLSDDAKPDSDFL